MKTLFRIIILPLFSILISQCSKDDNGQPDTTKPVISNLVYSPDMVPIKPALPRIVVNGNFDFQNATGGVAQLRITTSAGGDITVNLPPNEQPNGSLIGTFEFITPTTPGRYTFELWIIDKKGSSSNKLSGSIDVYIDDGATVWRNVSQDYSLHRVLWANNKYIAVGVVGTVVTSADGEHWTSQNSGISKTLFGVAWSGTQYVAVGDQKTILTSPDGVNWTPRGSEVNGIILYGVASSGSEYLAVGQDLNNNKTVILYSNDGTGWTEDAYTLNGGVLYSIRWTGNQYIAVGGAVGRPVVLTSSNGQNWINTGNTITIPGELADVVYSGTKYTAVGYGLTATSTDAVNWSGNMTNWGAAGVAWSGNRFVASSLVGIMVSTDGVNWTKTFDPVYPLRSITWSGLQYVSVGFVSPLIMVSP